MTWLGLPSREYLSARVLHPRGLHMRRARGRRRDPSERRAAVQARLSVPPQQPHRCSSLELRPAWRRQGQHSRDRGKTRLLRLMCPQRAEERAPSPAVEDINWVALPEGVPSVLASNYSQWVDATNCPAHCRPTSTCCSISITFRINDNDRTAIGFRIRAGQIWQDQAAGFAAPGRSDSEDITLDLYSYSTACRWITSEFNSHIHAR